MISFKNCNVNQKKRKLFLLIYTCLFSLSLWSQTIQETPVAIATSRGVWVYLGNEIPKEFEYQVLKKEGNGSFKPAATVRYNSELKELRSRAQKYNIFFSDLDILTERDLTKISEYSLKHNTTDSLFTQNLPITHLLIGTAYFDPEATAGVDYQYQVKKSKTGITVNTSNTVQLPAKTDIMKPAFKLKQELADEVFLQWYVPQQRKLGTFALYRRVYGTGDFIRVNARKGYNSISDTIYLAAADTTVKNPGYYEYYLKPMDIYGNPGPVSDIISAGPLPDATLTVPHYFRAKGSESNHEVNLTWKFTNGKYVRGIELYRSFNYDSGYIKIVQLPPTDTAYVDVVPVANENYYYYMQIQGPFEKTYPSAKIAAMFRKAGEKPVPPSEVAAETVPGGVKIYWTYTEPYLKGFFVFRYIYEKAEYAQVSGLIPPGSKIYSFIDSSASLVGNQDYRYAIKAVDDVEQMSDFSVTASAQPGIKASVETPVNLQVSNKEYGALLIWDDLTKSEPNLLGYKVYRKELNEKNFTFLAGDTLTRLKNFFSDSTVVEGKSYVYAVSAIDFYGNESAKSLSAYFNRQQSLTSSPEILRAVNTGEGIMIVWGQIEGRNITAYKVYRGSTENNAALIATVKPENDQYLDATAANGQLYVYRISVVTDNNESEKSRGISVRRRGL